jgi:hypothetical protein
MRIDLVRVQRVVKSLALSPEIEPTRQRRPRGKDSTSEHPEQRRTQTLLVDDVIHVGHGEDF